MIMITHVPQGQCPPERSEHVPGKISENWKFRSTLGPNFQFGALRIDDFDEDDDDAGVYDDDDDDNDDEDDDVDDKFCR